MPWAKFDDGYPSHPKMLSAGLEALGFDVCGVCYSSKYLTDGFIADAALAAVYPSAKNPRKLAAKLVEVGRWEEVEGGYLIHDFNEYNPRRENVEREREESRNRMRTHREKKRKRSGEQTPNGTDEQPTAFGNGSGVPTRPVPDPSRPSSLDSSSPPPSSNGHANGGGGDRTEEKLYAVSCALTAETDYDPADVEGAVALLRKRLVANEPPTSLVAWTEAVVQSMAEKREAAATADEPRRVVVDDGNGGTEELLWSSEGWFSEDERPDLWAAASKRGERQTL